MIAAMRDSSRPTRTPSYMSRTTARVSATGPGRSIGRLYHVDAGSGRPPRARCPCAGRPNVDSADRLKGVARLGALARQAIAVQVVAVHVEPDLGAVGVRAKPIDQPP